MSVYRICGILPLIICLTTISFRLSAQDSIQPKFIIHLAYGSQWPIASDLAKRYGGHGLVGLGIDFIKASWETGPSLLFLFGSNVKEDVLAPLRSPDGELIGSDHQLAEVDLKMRGTLIGWSIARLIKLNAQSMILIGIQPGWLTHWIRFQNPGSTFEPIQGNYQYGYDRLSSGFALSESLAYRYHSSNHLINFELGTMLTQSTSHLRRNIQLDNPAIKLKSSALLFGLQARWLLPIFPAKNAEHIYY